MYDFLRQQLTEQFSVTAVYKETEEKRVVRVRHKRSGEDFLVREFAGDRGSAECYRRLFRRAAHIRIIIAIMRFRDYKQAA